MEVISMYTMDICIDDVMREFVKNHKIPNKKVIQKAYEFALNKHKGQTRKSGEPYIMHPLRVARFIANGDSKVTLSVLHYSMIVSKIAMSPLKISNVSLAKAFLLSWML